ncbi:MAG: Carbohydrate binding domain protein, partial [Candidatus Methanoperedens nitroreducens]
MEIKKLNKITIILISMFVTLMAFSMPVKALALSNPGFESGTTPWLFYTNGAGSFTVGPYGYVGINAAKLTLNSGGGNIQLFQTGVALEANTRYRLSFAAYSTTGHDVTVRLIKHGSPY